LLSTNKKVAAATHNITAWRIKTTNAQTGTATTIQDCDDGGESAAGGRLLHLMQLMDVWNVIVVITRWYGGVKLGPDRFRLINSVAREALVSGGFVKDEGEKTKGKAKGKK
jgi:putative IMPACT (imprinted ancient) family translation regulator